LNKIKKLDKDNNDIDTKDEELLFKETLELQQRLQNAKTRKLQAQHNRIKLANDINESRQLNDALIDKSNQFSYEINRLEDYIDSLSLETNRITCQLKRFMQINVINDAFFIWYTGPFATINNFKLGNLPVKPVEWTEINAALGQAVLAVAVIALNAGLVFKKFHLLPMGSFSKIIKLDEKKEYSLFKDASFQLFPKNNFNAALHGFLTCIKELGDHATTIDPTLQLPYTIHLNDGKIDELSFKWDSDDEIWTRSLKFVLADIKWIITWGTKHCNSNYRNKSI
jgi:beclin 1